MQSTSPGLLTGRVLVTGATGRLGSFVCRALLEHGYDVRATDQRFAPGFPVRIELGDLQDEHFVYRVLDGCDAVVHLGNHPNAWCGPSRQKLLAENTAMNANVFFGAADLEVRRIVFSSSIQVALAGSGGHGDPPYPIPYLPLDGAAPSDPRTNSYALSKEHGERLLRLLCDRDPHLSATALRLPMLPTDFWLRRVTSKVPRGMLNWGDCLTFLTLPDAAELVVAAIARAPAGYRQYLPARTLEVEGYSLAQLVEEHYSHVPLRVPLERLTSFADISDVTADLAWEPKDAIRVTLDA